MPRRPRLPANIRRHGRGFRAVVELHGQRLRSPTFSTQEAAKVWLTDFRKRTDRPELAATLTLEGGLALIAQELETTHARAATVTYYQNHARALTAHFGAGKHLIDLRPNDVREFLAARTRAGVAVSTSVGKELSILRRILKLARERGYLLGEDPFAGLRLPKPRSTRFDFLTQDRLIEIVAKMRADRRRKSHWEADVIEFLFATGLRLSEFVRLRVRDIDLDARRLAVDGKTDNRSQPFGPVFVPLVRRLIAAAKPDGRLVSNVRVLERMFPKWQRKLGEPRLKAHVLRHSYATAMAPRARDPFHLKELMGHHDVRQTSRYYHGGPGTDAALDELSLDQQPPPPERRPSRGRKR